MTINAILIKLPEQSRAAENFTCCLQPGVYTGSMQGCLQYVSAAMMSDHCDVGMSSIGKVIVSYAAILPL